MSVKKASAKAATTAVASRRAPRSEKLPTSARIVATSGVNIAPAGTQHSAKKRKATTPLQPVASQDPSPSGEEAAASDEQESVRPYPDWIPNQYEEFVRLAAAPHETFWRKWAKPEARSALERARIPSAKQEIEKRFAMLAEGGWPTLDDCIPPGSILDVIDKYFWSHTDIPRELPIFITLHYIAGYLLKKEVEILVQGKQKIYTDFWTIVVAVSGAGKSLTQNAIAKAIDLPIDFFPKAGSAIKFLDNLSTHNRALYIQDEFAQLLKKIKTDSGFKALQGEILELYDNKDLSHDTMAGTIQIKRAALSILGTTATDTLPIHLTPEMMKDGFAQRFGYCYAEPDDREVIGLYRLDDLEEVAAESQALLKKTTVHSLYKIDEVGREVFESAFKIMHRRAKLEKVDLSFYRRLAFRTFKYAAVYHVITGKVDDTLHSDDLIYGANLAALGLRDFVKIKAILDESHGTKRTPASLVKTSNVGLGISTEPTQPHKPAISHLKLEKVEIYLRKIRDAKLPPISISALQAGVRAVKGNAVEARILAQKAVSNDPTLKPYVKLSVTPLGSSE